MSVNNLPDLDMSTMARSLGTVFTYHAGDKVFREGDPARHMYVVLKGSLEILTHGRSIDVIGPGKALGIISLIDGGTRTADAIAQTETEVAVLDARTFRYAVEAVPHFVWYVMSELAQRLRATNEAL